MKPSKLDPYRSLIIQKLNDGIPMSRICKELNKLNCSVSRAYLKEWILTSGIDYTPRKPGRPPSHSITKLTIFPRKKLTILPKTVSENIHVPAFLFGLREDATPEFDACCRTMCLNELNLPDPSSPPERWQELNRYADLSDLELMFLAFLHSDLGAPPFQEDAGALIDWYWRLANQAIVLKEAIAAAITSRQP